MEPPVTMKDGRFTTSIMSVNEAHEGCSMQFLPVIGFAQAVHLLEKSSPKQSAQYGLSSLNIRIETHETVDRMLC